LNRPGLPTHLPSSGRGRPNQGYATRPNVSDVLEKVGGYLGVLGEANITHHDRGHPMKELIYPPRTFVKTGPMWRSSCLVSSCRTT